jgi:hypothetical protein
MSFGGFHGTGTEMRHTPDDDSSDGFPSVFCNALGADVIFHTGVMRLVRCPFCLEHNSRKM